MLRNFIFSLFFFTGIFIISIFFLPSFFLPKRIVLLGGRLMGYWTGFCLKFFLSTKIIIKGTENIIKDEKFFIAASHQSMFETFYLQTLFNSPVFILKKELLLIPIFGWYLKKIGSIPVERNKISKEKINFVDTVKISSQDNRPIVIFPQGTRTNPNERPDFKKGVARIYQELNINCLPITINSGEVWPKKGNLSKNKKITITILKPIKPGLEGKLFLNSLQNTMYDVLNKTSSPSSA